MGVKEKKRREIREFLEKNLNYDGDADTKCPNCGYVLEKGRVWMYHYTSMCHNLAYHLGFSRKIGDAIIDIIQYQVVTGDPKTDAIDLAARIADQLYSD